MDPDPVNDIPAIRKTYTIGDDMLTEATAEYDGSVWTYYAAEHLMYDGHGSTRQLVTGSVDSTSIVDDFSYDGYGVLLQDEDNFPPNGAQDPGKVVQQATSMLYAGEHFDTDIQHYYNRARWYNPLTGLFNRMDPFASNNQAPQSLHKYLYCHANPVNGIDPSGEVMIGGYHISGLMLTVAIASVLILTSATVYSGIRHGLGPLAIAWQVAQILAVFVLIIGISVLTGPLALAASFTLLAGFVAGIISLVRNWPKMDTTDKVIVAITVLCFIAFAGAIRTVVPPKPSIQPGRASPLPESYSSKVAVDMRNAPPSSPTNAAGFPRNGPWFWRTVRNMHPEYFSRTNLTKIANSRSPVVDAQWIKFHPQHQSFIHSKLVHHHMGGGAYAVGVPEPVHTGFNNLFHSHVGE